MNHRPFEKANILTSIPECCGMLAISIWKNRIHWSVYVVNMHWFIRATVKISVKCFVKSFKMVPNKRVSLNISNFSSLFFCGALVHQAWCYTMASSEQNWYLHMLMLFSLLSESSYSWNTSLNSCIEPHQFDWTRMTFNKSLEV